MIQNTKAACAWWWISDTNLEGWNIPLSLFVVAWTMCQKSCKASSQATCKGCICPEPSGLASHRMFLSDTVCLPSASCSQQLSSAAEPLPCPPAGPKDYGRLSQQSRISCSVRILKPQTGEASVKLCQRKRSAGCSSLNFWGIFPLFPLPLLFIWGKDRVLGQSSFERGTSLVRSRLGGGRQK